MENDDIPVGQILTRRDALKNTNDSIYSGGGDQLLLAAAGDNVSGYAAAINISLDLTDTEIGASSSSGGPSGPPPP
jgi:hypothetical protein